MSIAIQSERLILREFVPSDAPEIFRLNADPDVIRYTGDQAFTTVDDAAWLIAAYEQYRKYAMGRLAVLLKSDGSFAGWCGLKRHISPDFVDLGFRLHKRYWGRGYATEAARACLHHGFETLKLPAITGRALWANSASIQVLKKIGMRHKEDARFHGEAGAIFTIDRHQFRAMNLPSEKPDDHQGGDRHKNPENHPK